MSTTPAPPKKKNLRVSAKCYWPKGRKKGPKKIKKMLDGREWWEGAREIFLWRHETGVKPLTGPTGSRIGSGTTGCIHWQGHRKWTEQRALVFIVVVFIVVVVVVLADEVASSPAVVRPGGRRRRGLGEEGQAEGGGGGALLTGGAAVRALLGADSLQHAALAFLQHVLLWRRRGESGEKWTSPASNVRLKVPASLHCRIKKSNQIDEKPILYYIFCNLL